MKLNSTCKSKKNHRKFYFKKRNVHLFKRKIKRSKLRSTSHSSSKFNYKLPFLTSIELIDKSSNDFKISTENSILFKDYLLVSANVKYKYLLCTLFDQVNFDYKENYLIVDGKQNISVHICNFF